MNEINFTFLLNTFFRIYLQRDQITQIKIIQARKKTIVYTAHFYYNWTRTNLIINDSLVNTRFCIFASKFHIVTRNNRCERTKRRAITAISQGMNTEIDSANAMMVERKARCRNLTNDHVLNRNNHPTNRLLSSSLSPVWSIFRTNIPETINHKTRSGHPAQFKTFSRIVRGAGDEGRKMGAERGIWCVVALGTYVRWPPRKLAPLLSPEKPNCRWGVEPLFNFTISP
ncbi:Uncharacterized protein DBV15_00666 [Temnothorax longispinosus]|uniref:Uncharacterized protein n=1 Tax=Temnothorax longispinosus TaxID=300112 RepID=A0A4S2KMN9_9HYME|nr:Uncharacterized protein DBV15_00666 [Temnothorax longispinosus]